MQTMGRNAIRKFATPALLLALVLPQSFWTRHARADAIDGHWCHADGRLISIAGPRIVTPGVVRSAATTAGTFSPTMSPLPSPRPEPSYSWPN